MTTSDLIPKFPVKPDEVRSVLASYMLADGFDMILDLEKSRGPVIVDARDGSEKLDFFTCFASMPIGFNHPKVKDEAFLNKLASAAANKPSNSDVYTTEMAEFVKTFFKLAVPDYFKYSFYVSGGALAVENALKAAFDRKVRKNLRKGLPKEKGRRMMHFKQAFHGRSGYTMSLTNTDPTKVMYFPKFDWPRISNPKIKFPLADNLDEVVKLEKQAVAEIEKAFLDNKDDIAGIIIEPIQGEGGDNHFRAEFFKELRRLADENDALLIYDEVQTGLGLTGKMWAHEHHGVEPDIMCFGKKMQTCGILSTDRIDDEPENVFKTSSRINSTWGGNLVDMVRSTRYLEIIDEEKLVENAATLGDKLLRKLVGFQEEFADKIDNARGKGLFCAFDLKNPDSRSKFIEECDKNGLVILPCGERSMRFRPPLNIKESELDRGLGIVENALKAI